MLERAVSVFSQPDVSVVTTLAVTHPLRDGQRMPQRVRYGAVASNWNPSFFFVLDPSKVLDQHADGLLRTWVRF